MSYPVTNLRDLNRTVTARVESRTSEGRVYDVTLFSPTSSRCTCPAGRRGRACWHVKAVREVYEGELEEARDLYREIKDAAWGAFRFDDDEVLTRYDIAVASHSGSILDGVRALYQQFCGPGTLHYERMQLVEAA